jgi:hypothetical protein
MSVLERRVERVTVRTYQQKEAEQRVRAEHDCQNPRKVPRRWEIFGGEECEDNATEVRQRVGDHRLDMDPVVAETSFVSLENETGMNAETQKNEHDEIPLAIGDVL